MASRKSCRQREAEQLTVATRDEPINAIRICHTPSAAAPLFAPLLCRGSGQSFICTYNVRKPLFADVTFVYVHSAGILLAAIRSKMPQRGRAWLSHAALHVIVGHSRRLPNLASCTMSVFMLQPGMPCTCAPSFLDIQANAYGNTCHGK